MKHKLKVGDHVIWNSQFGEVKGKIKKIHVDDFDLMGIIHHATEDSPQYEVKSDKTGRMAAHKETALSKISV
jgi:hypothetical protein